MDDWLENEYIDYLPATSLQLKHRVWSHLISQCVDVYLAFSFLLRLVEEWSSNQQEIGVIVWVNIDWTQLCTEIGTDLKSKIDIIEV